MIHHRKAEFLEIFQQVRPRLQYVFQTRQEVLILTASGTGAMETAVVNLLAPNEKALTIDAGKFGARWTQLCGTYSTPPIVLKKAWGEAVQPSEIRAALERNPDVQVVFLTYSETSTGVAIDLPTIAQTIRECSEALIVVDAISALVALPLKMDAWHLDVVISASQKGFMLPPGLGLIALSDRAWQKVQTTTTPRFYFSLIKARQALNSSSTPFTPASTLIIGLNEALKYIQTHGLETIWLEHQLHARAIRAALQALGFKLLTDAPSDAVTAAFTPVEIKTTELIRNLQSNFGIVVAGGQDHLKDKIIRVGHVGFYDAVEIIGLVAALEWSLQQLKHPFEHGRGLLAAQSILAQLFPAIPAV